ncbi:energy transducer TonB [Gluconacetobacter tumulicola]|uniref:TonB family protein n=1 Tax=Gluconacetobacter tumulicola TaxID=1017177 RepID=A0A7W4JED2_9PROT|nr:energy transducer TonB [Gluconacetobacter tumulicola]MBB2179731.1 TonB family protein [Gluconacetobacter tumulicola]
MTVTLSPSSRHRQAEEPVLIPRADVRERAARQPEPPERPDGREGLRPELVGRPDGYRPLKQSGAPMIRPDTVAEPGVATVLAVSAALHLVLLAIILQAARHHAGGSAAPESQSVEMMFTPPASSGLQGRNSPDQAGGSGSQAKPTPTTPQPDQPQPSDSSPSPSVPSPQTPAAPPLPRTPSDQTLPDQPSTTPPNPAMQSPGQAAHPTAHPTPRHTQTARQRTPSHAPSPFDHPMDLSFAPSPGPVRQRRGRAGGSGGPIDLSVGPVVRNGQLNAPYSSQTQVRGVSEDYGEEIDRWIRSHMYYPEEAARAGDDGASTVHVVLDRSGRVRGVRLTGQSGSYYLDAATTGMFHGAELPPVPPDMAGDHFDIDVTINYILIRR